MPVRPLASGHLGAPATGVVGEADGLGGATTALLDLREAAGGIPGVGDAGLARQGQAGALVDVVPAVAHGPETALLLGQAVEVVVAAGDGL